MRHISEAIPRSERRFYDNSGMASECRAFQIEELLMRKIRLENSIRLALKFRRLNTVERLTRKYNSVQTRLFKLKG